MDFKEIDLHNNKLRVYYDGKIEVLGKKFPNKGIFYEKVCINLPSGYLQLALYFKGKCKNYYVHRIVAMAFLGLDIDSKLVIDHEHHNTTDNSVDNIRIVTRSQNGMNFQNVKKGYTWQGGRWCASITKDGTIHRLGRFKSEEEAHQAYLGGRIKYFGDFA